MRYILLLFVILIAYGSLYPFHFSGDLLPVSDFLSWLVNLSYRTTEADILANILLFIPFGFVAIMTLATSRRLLYHASLLFLVGTLFAFMLQYLQFYLPARVPSAADAWYNSLGIIFGMLIAHMIIRYSHQHLTDEISTPMNWSQITIPLLLALLWVCWRLFPFIPSITTDSISTAVSPLIHRPDLNFITIIRDTIGWLVFFYLLTRSPFDKLSKFRILKFVAYIFGLEILIRGNVLTVNDLLAALFAFAIFASLTSVKLHEGLSRGLAVAIAFTLISPLSVAEINNQFQWQPFDALMKGNPWANGEFLLLKLYLFASFIYLLRISWFGWLGAALVSIFLILSLSLMQIPFGQNNGDITDPILAALIAWAMSQVEKVAIDERAMALH